MKKYGLPYQGSKNKLAERIIGILPSAENLYDVFAGGCAVSHCALMSGKWKKVFINDKTDSVKLFEDALNGNCPDGSEWISREEFYKRKDSDPYVRLVWSFGNNQRDYLYSQKLEPYKKAVHEMIFGATPNERRLKFKEVCRLLSQVIGSQENEGVRPADHAAMERSQRLLTDFNQPRLYPPPYSATNQLLTKQRVLSKNVPTDANQWSDCTWGGVRNYRPLADRRKAG